jgi:hypothetical protein
MNITATYYSCGVGVIEARFERLSLEPFTKTTPPVKLGDLWWVVEVLYTSHENGVCDMSCSLINVNNEDVVVDITTCVVNSNFMVNGYVGSARKKLVPSHGRYPLTSCRTIHAATIMNFSLSIAMSNVETEFVRSEHTPPPFVRGKLVDVAEIFPPDVTIRSSGHNSEDEGGIPAHKCILSLHSPVFRAMFKAGMMEASTSKVTIADYPQNVIGEFVQFLYADRTSRSKLREHGTQLLEMADKYQVTSLQAVCEHYLCSHIDADNVFDLLTLAERCGADLLKKTALTYIRRNLRAVAESGKVPDLPAEVVKDLLKELVTKSTV